MSNDLTTQRAPLTQRERVEKFKAQFAVMVERNDLPLPSSVSLETFRNAAIVAVQDNARILECSPASVFRAIRVLAAAGLSPDRREAAIVPYKGEAQPMPMVWGLVKIARQSGKIISLTSEVVYEGEKLIRPMTVGEGEWQHVREDGSAIDYMERGGAIRGAYAVAKLRGGGVEVEAMSRAQIEERRKKSANQKGPQPTGIWADWYGEMAKKTVLRRLILRLPVASEDVARIMAEEDAVQGARDVTPPETGFAARALAAREPEPDEAEESEDDAAPDVQPDVIDAETVEDGDAPTPEDMERAEREAREAMAQEGADDASR